jgi:hypothetical protein
VHLINFNEKILRNIFSDPELKNKFIKEIFENNEDNLLTEEVECEDLIESLNHETSQNKLITLESSMRIL